MTDEEAAEAYVERYGYPFWQEGDTELDRRRYSCDGCDQSQSSIKEAFLAGVDHGRKLIEQRERMAWEAAREEDVDTMGYLDPEEWEREYTYPEFDDWKKEQEEK